MVVDVHRARRACDRHDFWEWNHSGNYSLKLRRFFVIKLCIDFVPIQVACALLGNAKLLKSIDDLDDKPKLRHVICIDSNEDQFVGSQERLLKFTDENPNTETQPLDPPPCWTLTVTPATVSTTQVNDRINYSKFCFKPTYNVLTNDVDLG